MIPNGLRTRNLLKNTTNSPLAEDLCIKHSGQWLQLALDTQYHRLSKIRSYVFPMTQNLDQQLTTLTSSLENKRQHKINILLKQQSKDNKQSKLVRPEGFKNLSATTIDANLSDILNKGPSFVNPDPKHLPKTCLQARANLQMVADKLEDQEVPESTINEFKGGIARLIDTCERTGKDVLKARQLQYNLPSEEVTIIETDKSKRLVALDAHTYIDMVNKSTMESGNYQPVKKLNQPRTEQINFNKQLNIIIKKYEHEYPTLHKNLRQNICSDPLPCPVYCLPKDHKDGELKGRPIHAATDTPATSLSKYLTKSLNPLLKHIPAHLKNTEDFIEFLLEIDGDIQGFCSLDVCNLYGSIPLEDINNITPGVFTVVKRFFLKYKTGCELSPLSGKDFEALVRLCLTSDTVLINGKGYKQKSGLAMGNNLAPMLAIIYMNELDKQIIESCNGSLFLRRLIDDIFIAWTSNLITSDSLLSMANNLNDALNLQLSYPRKIIYHTLTP